MIFFSLQFLLVFVFYMFVLNDEHVDISTEQEVGDKEYSKDTSEDLLWCFEAVAVS